MRMIGHLDSGVKARGFSDYLTVKGIENQIEAEKDGTWSIWIHDEEELKWAKDLLALFQKNPADPQYQVAARAVQELQDKKRQEQLAYEKRVKQRRFLFRSLTAYGFGPVTFTLILMSVIVFLKSKFGQDLPAVSSLYISRMDVVGARELSLLGALAKRLQAIHDVLPEIREGQVWRLITPIFIHYTFLHIFLNMLWLRDLGSMIEARQSSWLLLVLVLVFAATSNVAQYFTTGASFGGMSGVVYGLVGYIWIRGKFDPGSGLFLHPTTVAMMVIWFFVCLIGLTSQNIANTAHAVGLLMGMSWGFLSSLRHR